MYRRFRSPFSFLFSALAVSQPSRSELFKDSEKLITIIAARLWKKMASLSTSLFRQQIADWITVTEEKFLAESLQVDSIVKPKET